VELPPRLGNYEPLLRIASGGMATIYVARHATVGGFERLVVIKRVHKHLLGDKEFCDMFRDEARISSFIRHASVVPVIDIVEANSEFFLVMEYVESLSLAQLLAAAKTTGERLPPPVVARILSDALAGLHAAHEAVDMHGVCMHVVHRDVSPHNILVDTHGMSSIIDFGIAKAASRIATTSTGQLKGKFRYMAPEQVKQLHVDRRADIFSAGVVLYEALTGRELFRGKDEGDTVLSVLVTEIPDPSVYAPGVSKELDAVAHEALERRRELRFATAARFREALEGACPLASTEEVGAIVARLGKDLLERRRKELRKALLRTSVRRAAKGGVRSIAAATVLVAVVTASLAVAVLGHAKRGQASPVMAAVIAPRTEPAGSPALAAPAASASADPSRLPSATRELPPATARPRHRPMPAAAPSVDSVQLHRRNPYASP
jgi:eukaryotic-like serine/threonine-protein kinase